MARPAERTAVFAEQPPRVGLVLPRKLTDFQLEPFYHDLLAGIDRSLRRHGASVVTVVASTLDEELSIHEAWVDSGAVNGVIIVSLRPNDPRLDACKRLRSRGTGVVAVGSATYAGGLPVVATEEAQSMHDTVRTLHDKGHRSIGHVEGPAELAHTHERSVAFKEVCAELGIREASATADYSQAAGATETLRLLAGDSPPTAVIYDNDLMAIGGLRAARERQLAVPGDLALVAWDDSRACQLQDPPLSAVARNVQAAGVAVGDLIWADMSAGASGEQAGVIRLDAAHLVLRGST